MTDPARGDTYFQHQVPSVILGIPHHRHTTQTQTSRSYHERAKDNPFFPLVSRKKIWPDAKCPFLELPPSIRRQIYHEAGLLWGRTIHINFWAIRQSASTNGEASDGDDDHSYLPSLPLGLFAVCRLVNNELTQIFYRENIFAIIRQAPRGLQALERFSGSTLKKFRFLIVRLNLVSCTNLCCGNRNRRCGNGHSSCSNPLSHDMI